VIWERTLPREFSMTHVDLPPDALARQEMLAELAKKSCDNAQTREDSEATEH